MNITKGNLSGLPLRPNQIDAIKFIRNSPARFIGINAPTGAGKTILGIEATDEPFYYLCTSKQLQEQVLRDYPDMKLLKGRSNYPCALFEHCGNCHLTGEQICPGCPYVIARDAAVHSPMTTLNFAYFLTACNYAGFYHKSVPRNIIIDEADELDTILTNFISFEFTRDKLRWLGLDNMPIPAHKTVIDEIPEWLDELYTSSKYRYNSMTGDVDKLTEQINNGAVLDKQDKELLNKYKSLATLNKKLRFLINQSITKDTWVYYYNTKVNKITLKPIWLTRNLTNQFLFNYGLRFIFMSATLPPKPVLARTMGLELNELDYFECDSTFPVESRKVIISPKYILGKKYEINETAIKFAVHDILKSHPDEKGIIHCVSFRLADIIKSVSPRLIIHNGQDKGDKYEEFLHSFNGVFVSPSSTRGLDLKDDLARFVIFLKVPFPDLADIMTSARIHSSWGNMWYQSQTIQSIVQGAGRGMRHEKDHCTTYILDRQIMRVLQQNSSLFPRWFKEAIWIDD